MSSKELYRRFLSLCQKWPKDETKVDRDFATFFRDSLGKHFPHGELGQVKDRAYVESALDSLEALANNTYFSQNQLKRSSSTGLDGWACREAISTANLREIQEQEELTLIRRLKATLNMKYKAIEPEIDEKQTIEQDSSKK